MSKETVVAGEWAAFVALDWGDREHSWALQAAGMQKRETGKLAQSPEASPEVRARWPVFPMSKWAAIGRRT